MFMAAIRTNFLTNRIFWLNFSFWFLFFAYKLYDFTNHMEMKVAIARIGLPMFFHIILSYTHYFFILPDLLRTKRVIRYFSRLIPAIAIIMFFQVLAENQVFNTIWPSDYFQSFSWSRFVSTLWDQMSFMIFTGMIKFAVDWFELENQKKELQNQKLNAELNYLKAQVNPHFLFNTLHNLNYLTQAKKDEASEVVIRLSNIMRYMIYDSSKSEVPVEKEVGYIKDYLNLEEIRLNNNFDIAFNTEIKNSGVMIAPLILIPFVENAFKHGISDNRPDSWIRMDLKVTAEELSFESINSVYNKKRVEEQSGFGLENLKQRLKLSYPDKFSLEVLDREMEYCVKLKVDLS